MPNNTHKPVIAHLISEFMQSNQSFTYRQFINYTKYKIVTLSRFYFKGSRKIFPVDELHYVTSVGRLYAFCEKLSPKIFEFLFEVFLKFWIKIRHIKLLHIHFGTFGAKLAYLRNKLNIPFVVSFYGSDTTSYPLKPSWQPLYKEMFAKVDVFLTLSETPRQQLISFGAPASKCFILPASVDTERFKYRARELKPVVTFLIAARFIEKKGYFVLLNSFRNLVNSGRSVMLVIVGFGELKTKIQESIISLGLSEFVELNDTSTISDYYSFVIPKYYDADVFVLPSIVASDNDQEGTPVTILEASATGLPIISTNVAGIPEVVTDSATGFIVPQKDENALLEKMAYLYDHPDIRKSMGLAGSKEINEDYSLKNLPNRLDQIYSMLI